MIDIMFKSDNNLINFGQIEYILFEHFIGFTTTANL